MAEKSKTVAELRAAYDALHRKCLDARDVGVKLEKKLLEEVKAKVKKHAGDLEDLLKQKRAASAALNAAEIAEKARLAGPAKPATATVQDALSAVKAPAAATATGAIPATSTPPAGGSDAKL
jgi:hypothetical protein